MAFLIVLCQRKGKLTSGSMFFSWLLFVVCSCIFIACTCSG